MPLQTGALQWTNHDMLVSYANVLKDGVRNWSKHLSSIWSPQYFKRTGGEELVVLTTGTQMVIIISGSASTEDWMSDFTTLPGSVQVVTTGMVQNISVHSGLWALFLTYVDSQTGSTSLQEWLSTNINSFSKVAVIGHSLGGAHALMTALYLCGINLPAGIMLDTVTFGAPRCIDRFGMGIISAKGWSMKCIQHGWKWGPMTILDIVPEVPPFLFPMNVTDVLCTRRPSLAYFTPLNRISQRFTAHFMQGYCDVVQGAPTICLAGP